MDVGRRRQAYRALVRETAMDTNHPQSPLDYATPAKRNRKWPRMLVLLGCVLGGLIVVWAIIAGGAP
jgi:hypothetical protein